MIQDDDLAWRIDAGELLHGRYEPLEVVGRGGQGEVLRAWDHHHHRPVALKIQQVRAGADGQHLLDEARTLLGLHPHPNVVVIWDEFFEDGHHHLVLDWIDGEDLRTRLRREGAPGLPYELVVAALVDVAAALDHLHAHAPPVVHGDVKPANIVVSEDEPVRAVLVDFGLATTTDLGEVDGATLDYAAPELMSGASAGPRSDLYSLAATALELLTGSVPAPGATLDWSAVPRDHLPGVRDALVRGLAIDPRSRPATATELIGAWGPATTTSRPCATGWSTSAPGPRLRSSW